MSVLDDLFGEAAPETAKEVLVPRKCAECKTARICSVLPIIIGITNTGIKILVEECPYNAAPNQ